MRENKQRIELEERRKNECLWVIKRRVRQSPREV